MHMSRASGAHGHVPVWYGLRVAHPDLNLLVVLDALLAEGSVARAARRLRLSPSAMSRALSRVRAATGDPLLVPSGRALVPTPRATELRDPVSVLVHDAEAVLAPRAAPDLRRLARTFTLRASDGFIENFGLAILARVRAEAPDVRLRFVQKPDKDGAQVREGSVDLETGVVDDTVSPELRAQALFQDRLAGVVRPKHALARGDVTAARYAESSHVTVSRPMLERGPIDAALDALGLKRESAIIVGGFASAITLARSSDLVATVPERHTESLRAGMHTFSLPLVTPQFTVSMIWHPRFDAEPVQRWLRGCVRDACAGARGGPEPTIKARFGK
jgi:DNA-binding transcriptional LysR family regulator